MFSTLHLNHVSWRGTSSSDGCQKTSSSWFEFAEREHSLTSSKGVSLSRLLSVYEGAKASRLLFQVISPLSVDQHLDIAKAFDSQELFTIFQKKLIKRVSECLFACAPKRSEERRLDSACLHSRKRYYRLQYKVRAIIHQMRLLKRKLNQYV